MDTDILKRSIYDQYINYLMVKKLHFTKEETLAYNFIFIELSKIPFNYIHPMDENRYIDGLSLRTNFQFDTDKVIDEEEGFAKGCTVLEMLVALAYRCEDQIMRNVDIGDRTKMWFFIMLENLGVKITNNEWNYDTSKYVKKQIDIFLNRKFDKDGSNGGLFPLKNPLKNQKNEQIWNQMMAYINENYFNDDPLHNLVLYSESNIR